MEIKITVERHRASVTQGTAVVLINGTPAATFGDTIELVKPGDKYYGEKIGNWASRTPDSQFVIGMLFHPYNEIYKISDKAKKIIEDLREQEEAEANAVPSYIEEIAQKYHWPMKIRARGEIATLVDVQQLGGGDCEPIYRFPGGDSLVSKSEMIPYREEE